LVVRASAWIVRVCFRLVGVARRLAVRLTASVARAIVWLVIDVIDVIDVRAAVGLAVHRWSRIDRLL
jgi:NADP-dependent 3-hydroxy acid dehydrogenase YdfG